MVKYSLQRRRRLYFTPSLILIQDSYGENL